MSKRPKWMNATIVPAQRYGIREAAKVLRHDAALRYKAGLRDDAAMARWYATALERVANGATWAEAFDLPQKADV